MKVKLFILFIMFIFVKSQTINPEVDYTYYTFKLNENQIKLFFFYEVSISALHFKKENNEYSTELNFIAEISSEKKIIKTENDEKIIKFSTYEETQNSNFKVKGFLTFVLDKKDYSIVPYINLKNSNNVIRLKNIELNLTNEKSQLKSFIVRGNQFFPNFNKVIPYSDVDYDLWLISEDTTITKIDVLLKQQSEKYEFNLTDYHRVLFNFSNYENKFIFLSDNGLLVNAFKIKRINKNLILDSLDVTYKYKNEENKIRLNVEWVDAPKSYMNKEFAVKILEVIDDKKHLDYVKNKNYLNYLNLFWLQYDPSPETSFNELKYEFYNRVDYAIENFNNLTLKEISDRTKIYIKYGKPSIIKREYNKRNETLEIWNYENLKLKFIFKDEKGLGDYKIVK